MNPFISLLINFLISFLTKIIQEWLDKNNTNPTSADLMGSRDEFLDEVQWRFWLGLNRLKRAEKAFDLAMANYSTLSARDSSSAPFTATALASMAVQGIATQL